MLTLTSTLPLTSVAEFSGAGTTVGIEEIFLGRCVDFTSGMINPNLDEQELMSKNCSHLWELFVNAFAYKDPCDVTSDAYEEFVNAAEITTPENKALFWDGWDVYDTVRSYANEARRANPLEFVLTGYLINKLVFCGQAEPPGINYKMCPDIGECGFALGSMDGFWAAASRQYGANAAGNVRVIFNSNRPGGAFHTENSFFTQLELAYMNPRKVSSVDIYLVTFLDEKPGDTCENGTVPELLSWLSNHGFNYECIDQPREILHLLCVDDIDHEECQLGSLRAKSITDIVLISLASFLIFCISCTFLKFCLTKEKTQYVQLKT